MKLDREQIEEIKRLRDGGALLANETFYALCDMAIELFDTKGLLGAANNALGNQASLLSAKDRSEAEAHKRIEDLKRGWDQECKDSDRILALFPHLHRTEGGWLPVAKLVNEICDLSARCKAAESTITPSETPESGFVRVPIGDDEIQRLIASAAHHLRTWHYAHQRGAKGMAPYANTMEIALRLDALVAQMGSIAARMAAVGKNSEGSAEADCCSGEEE